MVDEGQQDSTGVLTQSKPKTQKPPLYKVILHNDDYTPRFFVVQILISIFAKSETSAIQIMMAAHTNGHSVVGVYSHEVAEMKTVKANESAIAEGYPLRFSIEKE